MELLGGLFREGGEEYAVRFNPMKDDQIEGPPEKHPCLARPWTGSDE